MFKKIIIAAYLFLHASVAFAGSDYIGTVKVSEGDTSVTHEANQSPLISGGKIFEGDIIATRATGSVSVVFIDGTQLSIGPSSEVIMNRYLFSPKKKSYAFNMKLRKGSAIYASGRMAKLSPESVKIETPQATIGVRGTKFLVTVE